MIRYICFNDKHFNNICIKINTDNLIILKECFEKLPLFFKLEEKKDVNCKIILDIELKKQDKIEYFKKLELKEKDLLIHGGEKKYLRKKVKLKENENKKYFYFEDESLVVFLNENKLLCCYKENFSPLRDIIKNVLFEYLYSKGYFTLHAAAINYKNSTFLIIGDKGSGKTTLLLNLITKNKEIKLVSNDRIMICPNNKEFNIISVDSGLRITENTMELLSYEYTNSDIITLSKLIKDKHGEKYYIGMHDLINGNIQIEESKKLRGIIECSNNFEEDNIIFKKIPKDVFVDDEEEHPNWMNIFSRRYKQYQESMQQNIYPTIQVTKEKSLKLTSDKVISQLNKVLEKLDK